MSVDASRCESTAGYFDLGVVRQKETASNWSSGNSSSGRPRPHWSASSSGPTKRWKTTGSTACGPAHVSNERVQTGQRIKAGSQRTAAGSGAERQRPELSPPLQEYAGPDDGSDHDRERPSYRLRNASAIRRKGRSSSSRNCAGTPQSSNALRMHIIHSSRSPAPIGNGRWADMMQL